MINQVTLVGRLTRDPIVEKVTGGRAMTLVTLAVQRSFRNTAGEWDADFVNCRMWGRNAENLSLYCSKGSTICVTGRIATSRYENEGKMTFYTEVVADRLVFVDRKRVEVSADAGMTATEESQETVN